MSWLNLIFKSGMAGKPLSFSTFLISPFGKETAQVVPDTFLMPGPVIHEREHVRGMWNSDKKSNYRQAWHQECIGNNLGGFLAEW